MSVAYFLLGGKAYYALSAVLFAVAAGVVPFERWATRRRLLAAAVALGYVIMVAVSLPATLPVLPLQSAIPHGVVKARTDYQDELGWPALAAKVGRLARGADVVVASNYGEAGALELFGRGLPPGASADVTFRYWRPPVARRQAILVGFGQGLRLLQRLHASRPDRDADGEPGARPAHRALHTRLEPHRRVVEHPPRDRPVSTCLAGRPAHGPALATSAANVPLHAARVPGRATRSTRLARAHR